MLANSITLDDTTGDDNVYGLVASTNGQYRRLESTSSLAYPREFNISHYQVVPKVGSTRDRHVIQFRWVKAHPTNAVAEEVIVNCTLTAPRSATFSADDIMDLVSNLKNFLTVDNVKAVLRGES